MKYIVLSFDDGFRNFQTRALKILKKHNLKAVLNVISEYTKENKLDRYLSWEEIKDCHKSGMEIATHSANHTNTPEEIIRGAKDVQAQMETEEKIGFASPFSQIHEANFEAYKSLITSGEIAYIRSGNQVKRDGIFYTLLYLLYKHLASKSLFLRYNKRNIISLDQKDPTYLFPSVTCNLDNTMEQMIYLIEKMPENSACVIMFHHILESKDEGYKKVKWSNTIEDFDFLCRYLSQNKNVSVISHKALCDLMKDGSAKE